MIPAWLTPAAAALTFVLMLALEWALPLRRRLEPTRRHIVRNLALGAVSLAVVTPLQALALAPILDWAAGARVGLLNLVALPAGLELCLGVLLLDYTLWHWHRINHLWPLLWRFHVVHHIDLDLDASTAFRFHFGELTLSIGYRVLQILAIGPSLAALFIWQLLLFMCILFHHSNLRLPVGLERVLVRVVVTPRMHGIHHSLYRSETNANWSSLLSVWDYLHRTLVLNVPQGDVVIGVATCREPRQVTLGRVLLRPFDAHPEDHAPDPLDRPPREPLATLAP